MLHPGGVAVVVPHEVFHRQYLAAILVAEEGGQMHLQIEVDLIRLATGMEMQFIAQPPEVVQGGAIDLQLLLGDDPLNDQFPWVVELELDPRHPQGGLQVPQATFALLDVGLQQVDRVAVLLAALLHLGDLLLDEAVA